MTTLSTQDQQLGRFWHHTAASRRTIDVALRAVARGHLSWFHPLLAPLIAAGNIEALYLDALYSRPEEGEEALSARHLHQVEQAAEAGYAPAIFHLAPG